MITEVNGEEGLGMNQILERSVRMKRLEKVITVRSTVIDSYMQYARKILRVSARTAWARSRGVEGNVGRCIQKKGPVFETSESKHPGRVFDVPFNELWITFTHSSKICHTPHGVEYEMNQRSNDL